ncbi:MAG TPA: zinc-binding alcohol dehydrogenase family protein [Bacillota bacterium]|nr:zinc-binding alcohol dehydrogenase family protein [Bacillota bacterium]
MKCIQILEPRKAVVKEIGMPRVNEGEALLKVLYGGICGSDMGLYKGKMQTYATYPRTPGHELSAEIIEVAEKNDYNLKKGMIVTVNPYFNCGHCYSCERGYLNCCVNNQTMGLQREGGFAEYITMPLDRIYDGQGIDALRLTLVEPFAISYHAVKKANIEKGDKVLVVGAGTIGMFAMFAAKLKGGEVFVSDVAESKLYTAQKLGADGIILNDDNSTFINKVNMVTDGRGFDVTVEAVGLPGTMMNCMDAAAHMGRVVEVGIGSQNLDFEFNIIQKKELNIMGSRNALKEDFMELIEVIKSGTIDLMPLVTGIFGLEEAPDVFRELDFNIGNNIKTLIKF